MEPDAAALEALVGHALRWPGVCAAIQAPAACAVWQLAAHAVARRALTAAGAIEALMALVDAAHSMLQGLPPQGTACGGHTSSTSQAGEALQRYAADEGVTRSQLPPLPHEQQKPRGQQEGQQPPAAVAGSEAGEASDEVAPPMATGEDCAAVLSASLGALALLVIDPSARQRLLSAPAVAETLVSIAEAPVRSAARPAPGAAAEQQGAVGDAAGVRAAMPVPSPTSVEEAAAADVALLGSLHPANKVGHVRSCCAAGRRLRLGLRDAREPGQSC
jgi:hypothetical protein